MVYLDSHEIIIKKIQIIFFDWIIQCYRIVGDALVAGAKPIRTSSNWKIKEILCISSLRV